MNLNYELYLTEKLNIIKNTNEYKIDLEISTEQAFAKVKTFKPNTVYVVIKYLSSEFSYNLLTQPIQILAIAEQNQIDITRAIFEEFTNTWNWKTIDSGTTYAKQQYSTPVVLSNFNEVGFGYRSVVYVSGTLQIMENVNDIEEIEIDYVNYKPLSFSISYQMTGNTQAVGDSRLAVTEKNMATLTVSMAIPLLDNDLCNKCLEIINGTRSGNESFWFWIGFISGIDIQYNLKLVSCQILTAPNQAPSLQLAFMR